jgi:hypothetical protein
MEKLASGLKFFVAGLVMLAVLLTLVTTNPEPASAYCYSGNKWSSGTGHQAWADTTIPQAWSNSLSASVAAWNGVAGSTWNMSYTPPGFFGPPAFGGWIGRQAGGAAQAGVPGWTVSSATQGSASMTWANTYLNSDWTWNTTGTMNQAQMQVDVRTVTTHELGHWLRLLHPNQCHAPSATENAAVMTPNFVQKWNLNSDDIAAIAAVY